MYTCIHVYTRGTKILRNSPLGFTSKFEHLNISPGLKCLTKEPCTVLAPAVGSSVALSLGSDQPHEP